MRCLALADAMKEIGWHSIFTGRSETPLTAPALAVSGHGWRPLENDSANDPAATMATAPEGCDLLVVDHYDLDATFECQCRPWAKRVMVIDDLANRDYDCDYLLDQTLGRNEGEYRRFVPKNCRLLLGPDHALLRPQFMAARPRSLERRKGKKAAQHILISFGAGDPDNLTTRALDGLSAAQFKGHVDVVLGKGAAHLETVRALAEISDLSVRIHIAVQDMAGLMADADLAIGAGGTTSWERCCLGLPSLIVVIADNQKKIAAELERAGAASMLGWHENVDANIIARKIIQHTFDPGLLAAMSANAAAICDGLGTMRVREALAA